MKNKVFVRFLLAIICLGLNSEIASAACRTKTVAKASDEINVIVPFAVPVGVPVAPFAPYFYSYQQYQGRGTGDEGRANASAPPTPAPATVNTIPSPVAVQSSSPDPRPAPLPPQSLVASRCAICHSGTAPKAGLALDHLENLSTSDRLRAAGAVATGRMPKGGKLSPEEMQSIIGELANVSSSSQIPTPNK